MSSPSSPPPLRVLEPGHRRRDPTALTHGLVVVVLILASWGFVAAVALLVWLLLEAVA